MPCITARHAGRHTSPSRAYQCKLTWRAWPVAVAESAGQHPAHVHTVSQQAGYWGTGRGPPTSTNHSGACNWLFFSDILPGSDKVKPCSCIHHAARLACASCAKCQLAATCCCSVDKWHPPPSAFLPSNFAQRSWVRGQNSTQFTQFVGVGCEEWYQLGCIAVTS